MSKRIVKTSRREAPASVIVDGESIDLEDAGIDPSEIEDSNKLSEFLDQFGGKEYKVRVDQMNATDKVWEYLDTFPVDGFDAFETCKRFGRGRYRLTFLNEKGKYVKGGQPQLRIGGVIPQASGAAVPQTEQDPLKHPMVVAVLGMMERSNAQTTELLKTIAARPEPQKSSTVEVLEMMDRLKRMNPEDPMKKISEALMMKMIEKGLDGGDSSGGDKSAWQEIVEGLKDAKEMGIFDRILGARKSAVPPKTQEAREVRVQLPQIPQEPASVSNPLNDALRPYSAIFVNKAANGVSVADGASYLVDEFYETIIPLIKKHVWAAKFMSEAGIAEYAVSAANDPEQIEALFAVAPELVPHREWVVSVIAEAVRIMTSQEEPANASSDPQAA